MNDVFPITKYEKVRLLGQRASQLSNGAPPTVDITGMRDPLKIAEKEFNCGKIPLKIIRTMPNGDIMEISLTKRVLAEKTLTKRVM
jgi:DNA-directed RNA polymerase I, II, and III subunit RPABC2